MAMAVIRNATVVAKLLKLIFEETDIATFLVRSEITQIFIVETERMFIRL